MRAGDAQNPNPPRWRNRLIFLVTVAILLAAGWSGAWFWSAKALDRWYQDLSLQLESSGGELDCGARSIRGFPFRIGMSCDRIAIRTTGGDALEAGALRSAAQFYAPGHGVAELDGPASLSLREAGTASLDWDAARASVRIGLEGPRALSLDLRNPVLAAGPASQLAPATGTAESAQLHVRRNPQSPGSLDVAVDLRGFMQKAREVPPFSVSADATVDALADRFGPGFELGQHLRMEGLTGTVRNLVLLPAEGGRLELSGPFSIDARGILDAQVRVAASGLPAIASFLAALAPDRQEEIRAAADLLSAIFPVAASDRQPVSGQTQADQPEPQGLTIAINRGKIRIGLLPLGEVPPLWPSKPAD